MVFATTSGNGLRTCFPASWATSVPPPVTIVALSRRCCTGTVREHHGGTCPSARPIGGGWQIRRNPASTKPLDAARIRSKTLQRAPLDRELLPQTQAVPGHREG